MCIAYMSNPIPEWERKYDLIFDQQTKRNAQVSIKRIQPENGRNGIDESKKKQSQCGRFTICGTKVVETLICRKYKQRLN